MFEIVNLDNFIDSTKKWKKTFFKKKSGRVWIGKTSRSFLFEYAQKTASIQMTSMTESVRCCHLTQKFYST